MPSLLSVGVDYNETPDIQQLLLVFNKQHYRKDHSSSNMNQTQKMLSFSSWLWLFDMIFDMIPKREPREAMRP